MTVPTWRIYTVDTVIVGPIQGDQPQKVAFVQPGTALYEVPETAWKPPTPVTGEPGGAALVGPGVGTAGHVLGRGTWRMFGRFVTGEETQHVHIGTVVVE